MALIDCDECGKQISDKAQHCVHCGVAIEQHTGANVKQKNSSLVSNVPTWVLTTQSLKRSLSVKLQRTHITLSGVPTR